MRRVEGKINDLMIVDFAEVAIRRGISVALLFQSFDRSYKDLIYGIPPLIWRSTIATTNRTAQVLAVFLRCFFPSDIFSCFITEFFNFPVNIVGHELRQERIGWRGLP